ncbi:MAG: hypothetical protein VX300_05925 [Acidobacteriota bacterium]|nr:hypothetical protein [Acidobacteriota bacterium]
MFSFSLRRSLALVLCFSIMAVASVTLAQDQQAELMKIVIAAEEMLNQGQPEQALAELQKVLSQDEEFAPAYFLQGMVYARTGDMPKAYENMIKATEYDPTMGIAHRMASQGAGAMGNFDGAWEHAIKAHQAGTDMSDAFAALSSMGEPPAGLEAAMAVPRVWIGPMDTSNWEATSATAGGSASGRASDDASSARILSEAAQDIQRWGNAARKAFADSSAFGLVSRAEQATYMLQLEVDSMADNSRRRTRGYLKLVDVQSGEEGYRRRVTFADIGSDGDLIRDFDRIMSIMEEWAEEQRR